MIYTETLRKIEEKVYLIIPVFDNKDVDERINEGISLVESSGAECVGYGIQKIREINPATLFGVGKLEEMKRDAEKKNATTIICDYSLSSAQTSNLSDFFEMKTLDKTALILDIFALNAKTEEGKLQVEVAQLEYLLPRLKGQGKSLSRLGGGIGTRGPGETKLETDRRHILSRIKGLKDELKRLEARRNLQNDRREKNGALKVALAGYTNSGKSTLLNLLSGSDVLSEDRLFATLDPTARKVKLGKTDVILFDTVGFIRDIPTNLIDAFKSTLSCVKTADLILNVCDLTRDYEAQHKVTESILEEIGVTSPVIKVLNKCDEISDFTLCDKNASIISAKKNIGIEELKKRIEDYFENLFTERKITLSFSEQELVYKLKKYAERTDVKYNDDFIEATFRIRKSNLPKFSELLKSKG